MGNGHATDGQFNWATDHRAALPYVNPTVTTARKYELC